jgi:hypothetical protein
MSVAAVAQKVPDLEEHRPPCPTCGVPMWLIEIEHTSSRPPKTMLTFECKACDATAVIPPLD